MAGENAFADYKQFWGLATRYCKLACTFAGLVNLVGISAQSNISASRPRTVGWCRRRQIDEYDTLALSAVCYSSSPVGSPAGLFFGSPAKTGTPREACASRRDFASGFPWGQAGHTGQCPPVLVRSNGRRLMPTRKIPVKVTAKVTVKRTVRTRIVKTRR